MRSGYYNTRPPLAWIVLGWLLLAVPAWGQLEVGNDVSLSLTGDLGFGYSGEYGNTLLSSHSTGLNGVANLDGYYYNPRFLNFYFRPSYNRSQANSGAQSITNATNFNMGAGIFSGSHFPGSVAFGENLNSTGSFGLPSIQGFTTHGNSRNFGLGWAALVPDWPTLSVNYSQTWSASEVFGSNEQDHSNSRNIGLTSNYNLRGWLMTARFNDLYSRTEFPSFLTQGEPNIGYGTSKTFSYNTSHRLPLRGSIALSYAHASFNGDGNGTVTTGSNNNFAAVASFVPWTRLTSTFGLQYDSSLNQAVIQELVAAGGLVPHVSLGQGHSLSFYNFDTLNIYKNLNASFNFNRIQQKVYGRSIGVNRFSAIVTYNFHKPFWGAFTVYGGVNDQSSDTGHQGTGMAGGLNFSKMMARFDVSGSFGYAQNVQTVLATSVTSNYTYITTVKHNLGRRAMWYSNFHGFHTGLGQLPGSSSHAESFGSNVLYRGYNAGFAYAQSSGTALVGIGGLVQPPGTVPPPLTGNEHLLTNGSSYSISGSASPLRRWSVSASFSKTHNEIISPALNTVSSSKAFNTYTAYQFRKMSFGGGYTHFRQGIGAAGTVPANFSSYYFGIQRWFHPF